YFEFFLSETGFIEVATFAFLVLAIAILFRLLFQWHALSRLIRGWLLFLLAGSIYFAGEEIDWGQVWIEISTPEVIEEVNREGQFSLHKIDFHTVPRFIFNNGPRLAATLVMFFGGIVALRRRRVIEKLRPKWRDDAEFILPTPALAVSFLLAALSTVPAKIIKAVYATSDDVPTYLELSLRKPSGEFKEYCIALSIMLYAWSLYRRHAKSGRCGATTYSPSCETWASIGCFVERKPEGER
ncbi:MAG: hypothetical protein R6V56_02985, partial [Lentisphaeria bacterium]